METAGLPEAPISAVKLAGPPPQSSTPLERSSADNANISSYSLRERPQGTIWSRETAISRRQNLTPLHDEPLSPPSPSLRRVCRPSPHPPPLRYREASRMGRRRKDFRHGSA